MLSRACSHRYGSINLQPCSNEAAQFGQAKSGKRIFCISISRSHRGHFTVVVALVLLCLYFQVLPHGISRRSLGFCGFGDISVVFLADTFDVQEYGRFRVIGIFISGLRVPAGCSFAGKTIFRHRFPL